MDVKYREEIVKSVRDDYLDRREERRNFECQWQLNTNFVMGRLGRFFYGKEVEMTI